MRKLALINFLTALLLIIIVRDSVYGQSSRKLIHDGNEQYQAKKYNEAEINYRKSLNTKENQFIGNYNLGNTFYQQGKYDEAAQQFQTASAVKPVNENQLSKNYHNLGNSLLKGKKYEESIQAYKQALKLNPKDNDTRYNLAYAQSMLQQQQQQQNKDKNEDNKNDKDKKQDQQKSDQQKDKQNQQKQQQKDQQQDQAKKEEQNKQEQQPRKDKISKDDAEKILQALNNEEKKTQKKLNVKQPVRVSIEKEW